MQAETRKQQAQALEIGIVRLALERGRGRLVQAAHALVTCAAATSVGSLEREPEHLEIGDAEPSPELRRRERRSSLAVSASPPW